MAVVKPAAHIPRRRHGGRAGDPHPGMQALHGGAWRCGGQLRVPENEMRTFPKTVRKDALQKRPRSESEDEDWELLEENTGRTSLAIHSE